MGLSSITGQTHEVKRSVELGWSQTSAIVFMAWFKKTTLFCFVLYKFWKLLSLAQGQCSGCMEHETVYCMVWSALFWQHKARLVMDRSQWLKHFISYGSIKYQILSSCVLHDELHAHCRICIIDWHLPSWIEPVLEWWMPFFSSWNCSVVPPVQEHSYWMWVWF